MGLKMKLKQQMLNMALIKYIKFIKFDTDDDLPLNKLLKVRMLTIIVRSVFKEDAKLYPKIYLDKCL